MKSSCRGTDFASRSESALRGLVLVWSCGGLTGISYRLVYPQQKKRKTKSKKINEILKKSKLRITLEAGHPVGLRGGGRRAAAANQKDGHAGFGLV